jgi:hypothetical protein
VNEKTSKRENGDEGSTDFIVAKVSGRFLRFQTVEEVPEGAENLLTRTVAEELTNEKLGEIYGIVAGVSTKKFRDKKIALESLTYQIAKLEVFDPNAPVQTIKTPAPGEQAKAVQPTAPRPAPTVTPKSDRKLSEMFELLSPPETGKLLGDLAPQARELIIIMTELATEKKSTKFSAVELATKLATPETKERLKTRQDPQRIMQYYKGKLIGSGLIKTT